MREGQIIPALVEIPLTTKSVLLSRESERKTLTKAEDFETTIEGLAVYVRFFVAGLRTHDEHARASSPFFLSISSAVILVRFCSEPLSSATGLSRLRSRVRRT